MERRVMSPKASAQMWQTSVFWQAIGQNKSDVKKTGNYKEDSALHTGNEKNTVNSDTTCYILLFAAHLKNPSACPYKVKNYASSSS